MYYGCDEAITKLLRSGIAHTDGVLASCEHTPQNRSAFLEDDEQPPAQQPPVQQPIRRSGESWYAVRRGCRHHLHSTDTLRTAPNDGQHLCHLHDSCEAATQTHSQRYDSMPWRTRFLLPSPSHFLPPATIISWRSAYDCDDSLRVAAPQAANGKIRRARFCDLRCPAVLACIFALMLGSVEGQAICATHSTARGLATTSATAGIPASFTIQV